MLTLTDDKLLKFVLIWGKSCVAFVWGEKLGWPRTLFIILLTCCVVLTIKIGLKEHCRAEEAKFRLAFFYVISPNATKYTAKLDKKRFHRAKQKQ